MVRPKQGTQGTFIFGAFTADTTARLLPALRLRGTGPGAQGPGAARGLPQKHRILLQGRKRGDYPREGPEKAGGEERRSAGRSTRRGGRWQPAPALSVSSEEGGFLEGTQSAGPEAGERGRRPEPCESERGAGGGGSAPQGRGEARRGRAALGHRGGPWGRRGRAGRGSPAPRPVPRWPQVAGAAQLALPHGRGAAGGSGEARGRGGGRGAVV